MGLQLYSLEIDAILELWRDVDFLPWPSHHGLGRLDFDSFTDISHLADLTLDVARRHFLVQERLELLVKHFQDDLALQSLAAAAAAAAAEEENKPKPMAHNEG